MKRQVKLVLIMVVIMSLVLSSFAYAKAGGNGNAYGIEKNREKKEAKIQARIIKNAVQIARKRLRVNGLDVDYGDEYTFPVIKEGRTLLPVRAITNALGGFVYWELEGLGGEGSKIATIISPDWMIRIDFDLKEDGGISIYEFDGTPDFDDLDPLDPKWELKKENISLDVLPGLISNRTYVPLRFIAETFGLRVYYDDDTGQIDIDDGPKLTPDHVQYNEPEDVPDEIRFGVVLRGYTLVDINRVKVTGAVEELVLLDEGANKDYTTQAAIVINTTDPGLIVTLDEDYVEELYDGDSNDEEEAVFELKFIKGISEVVERFKVKLKFID